MHLLDWLIVVAYLVYIVVDGIRRSQATHELKGYFLANRSLPWWAVGLSIMATQMSAITLVGTTGQGYQDGMRFIQFYFGLPLAMVILCLTVVPFFHRSGIFTAYEYLEQRFDARTRTLTSLLFLVSRGLQCGVIISAPAVILSMVLGWNLILTVLAIGLPTVVYTMIGGVQAVTWADVKQMVLIVTGMAVVLIVIVGQLPEEVSFSSALQIAGAAGRLETVDFSFDPSRTYTFWTGLLGGTFLMLSYFGCDQSQVQRYLTARSVTEGRVSLLMSAFLKIPLQFAILLIGVLVFVFFNFSATPIVFSPAELEKAEAQSGFAELARQHDEAQAQLRETAIHFVSTASGSVEGRQEYLRALGQRDAIREDLGEMLGAEVNDVNYVFPYFITHHLPIGIVGIMIAAIFAAAMSSVSAELNALSAATVMDIYRPLIRKEASDVHYLRVSKLATAGWGLIACSVAVYASRLGALIEVVNLFGSFFYGSLLGVFVLAIGTRWATPRSAFAGLLAGMGAVAFFGMTTEFSFLWYNLVGVVTVVVVAFLVSLGERFYPSRKAS